MFYGAMGYAEETNTKSTRQSKSATNTKKISSNNIHFDEIVIKSFPGAQSGNSPISDEEHNRLVSKISNNVENEVSDWIHNQTIFGITILLAGIAGLWAFISRSVEVGIAKHVDKLDKKRDEASDATTKVKHEIELAQETLKEFRKKENEINKKIDDFQNEIINKEKEIIGLAETAESIKDNLSSITQDFELKTTDEIFRLEKKIKALKLIVNKVDKDRQAESQIIDELILKLNSANEEDKYTATELLSKFDFESEKIVDAFVEILKNNQNKTFELLLLIGLSELRGESNKILAYLIEAVDNLSNPNILAIIGALGNLGDLCKTKELEAIVDKLLSILNDDLDHNEFAIEITASRIRGAIALALSCSGFEMVAEKAVPLLIKLLIDEDQGVRINAAIALGVIGKKAKEAIPALRKLENDDYAEVRGAASESIKKIQQTA